MQILVAALLALTPAAQPDQGQQTEQKGTSTTAAVPNDDSANDVSQSTAQPLGHTDVGGVASNPNETNAKSPDPQEGHETRAKPRSKTEGKAKKSHMHQTGNQPAGSVERPVAPSTEKSQPVDTRQPVDDTQQK